MATDPTKPTNKPPKSPDSHGGAGLRPMSGSTRAHRIGKISSANEYSAQRKSPIKPISGATKEFGLQRQENRQVLGNFHKGGRVKKSGAYNLKKGEKVVAAKRA